MVGVVWTGAVYKIFLEVYDECLTESTEEQRAEFQRRVNAHYNRKDVDVSEYVWRNRVRNILYDHKFDTPETIALKNTITMKLESGPNRKQLSISQNIQIILDDARRRIGEAEKSVSVLELRAKRPRTEAV